MSDLIKDCIFCSIIEGAVPTEMVYEDDECIAFWDAHPAAPLHILIVPRRHIPTLNDIDPDDTVLAHLGRVAARIAEEFGVAQPGYRVFINVNSGGGQVVFHLHVHLISRNYSPKRG
jgi:histidine triad (HIT) family protein